MPRSLSNRQPVRPGPGRRFDRGEKGRAAASHRGQLSGSRPLPPHRDALKISSVPWPSRHGEVCYPWRSRETEFNAYIPPNPLSRFCSASGSGGYRQHCDPGSLSRDLRCNTVGLGRSGRKGSGRSQPRSWATIEKTPGVCRGAARVAGTRVPAWQLIEARGLGASEAQLLIDYPRLKAVNLVYAWACAEAHPDDIAGEIHANEVA